MPVSYLEMEGIGRVAVRSDARIRQMSIQISARRGVWLNVPYGVSAKHAVEFLREKRDWIMTQIPRVQEMRRRREIDVTDGKEIRTRLYTVRMKLAEADFATYKTEGRTLTLFVPRGYEEERRMKVARNFLQWIYRREAMEVLPPRVKKWAEQGGFRYTRLSFRNNVSNWGSCSVENHISLNIKLMTCPDELIDYVIVHELCHTVEKNHSAAFWALVEHFCPDYRLRREQLNAIAKKG